MVAPTASTVKSVEARDERGGALGDGALEPERDADREPGARDAEQQGLTDQEAGRDAVAEAQGLHDAEVAGPLSAGQQHGVEDGEEDREQHRAADQAQQLRHVAEHRDELAVELGLGGRLDALRAVGEHLVDGALHGDRVDAVGQLEHVEAGALRSGRAALLERLLDVGELEEHLLLVERGRGALVDRVDLELPRAAVEAREDGAVDRDAVADLPAVFLGQLLADDAASARPGELLVAAVDDAHLGVAGQERLGVDAELREEAALVLLVAAAEPLPLADRLDARHRRHLLLVAERQVDEQADRGLHQ